MSCAAVVVNPTKLDDDETFRISVRLVKDDHGWDVALWLRAHPSGKTPDLAPIKVSLARA